MDVAVLAPLNALEDSINTLITSLTTTNTFTGATAATDEILAADDTLTSALTLLKQHQDNYRTILKLNAEAESLRTQLKDTLRTCNNLRTEIGQINPAILEDDDSDDEGSSKISKAQDVDYDTLLAFAARIGKHNAAAAREAEQESIRRRTQALRNKGSQVNGDTTSAQDLGASQTATQESQAALSAINEALSFQRAAAGMAFPAPDHLRMGVLGQLQLLREQEGEQAVEKEVERLVRISEAVANEGGGGTEESGIGQPTTVTEEQPPPIPKSEPNRGALPSTMPPREQKKVNLDFDEFNSDEDD